MYQRTARLLAVVCSVGVAAVPNQEDFSLPAPMDTVASNLDLWATHYFVHAAAEVNSGVPLRDKTGNAITGNLSPRDWCLGAIEGTIQVTSERHFPDPELCEQPATMRRLIALPCSK